MFLLLFFGYILEWKPLHKRERERDREIERKKERQIVCGWSKRFGGVESVEWLVDFWLLGWFVGWFVGWLVGGGGGGGYRWLGL